MQRILKPQMLRAMLRVVSPILIIAGLAVILGMTQQGRYSNVPIIIQAGKFEDAVNSRALLQKLSSALNTYPKHRKFQIVWIIEHRVDAKTVKWMQFQFGYNRKTQIFEQAYGGFEGFSYGGVSEKVIHVMAATEPGVPLTMENYVNGFYHIAKDNTIQKANTGAAPMFLSPQRRKYGITLLSTPSQSN